MKAPPRPAATRAAQNSRFKQRLRDAGIVPQIVLVPASRLTQLRELTAEWRREARLLLESDLPTAEQILQIHGVCRALDIPLPVSAFATRFAASAWLESHEAKLDQRRVRLPCIRPEPA